VKAIGNDPISSSKGGMDELSDELGSAGGKEKEFRFGLHRMSGGIVLQELADGFPEGGSSRFADLVNSKV
jgi:hypothetical protein